MHSNDAQLSSLDKCSNGAVNLVYTYVNREQRFTEICPLECPFPARRPRGLQKV